MSIVTFLVVGLAVWRISSLLVNENGPFYVFRELRERAGIHNTIRSIFGKNANTVEKVVPDTFFAQLLSCVWCCSIWVGFSFTLLLCMSEAVSVLISLPFAWSAVSIFLNKHIEKDV